MLVTPRSKKLLDFLDNFKFTTKNLFGEIWVVDAGRTFDLSNCFYFVTAISSSTLLCVFYSKFISSSIYCAQ